MVTYKLWKKMLSTFKTRNLTLATKAIILCKIKRIFVDHTSSKQDCLHRLPMLVLHNLSQLSIIIIYSMSKKMNLPKKTFLICTGKKCRSKGGINHYKNLKGMIRKEGKKEDLQAIRLECTGNCKMAPVVGLMPKNKWYGKVDDAKIDKLFYKAIKHKEKKGYLKSHKKSS